MKGNKLVLTAVFAILLGVFLPAATSHAAELKDSDESTVKWEEASKEDNYSFYGRTGTKFTVKTFTCTVCGNHKITTLAKLAMPKAGTKYVVGGNTYIVTKVGSEVSFSKANTKAKSITVPNTIKVSGITYKVTSVGANAFKNCKSLTTVTIGTNVKTIKANAFNNCPKLKKVTIKTVSLSKKTASKKCFNKVSKKMVIKVPKKVKKAYAEIFKGLTVK